MGQTAEELRQQLASQREHLGRDLDAIGDRVSPHRMVERRRAAMRQRVVEVKERVMGAAEDTADAVRGAKTSAVAGVGDSAASITSGTRHATQGNPLAAGLVAFGAGLVVAAAFPATRPERRLAEKAEPMLESAAHEAGPAVRHALQELQPVAEESVSDLKEATIDAARAVKQEVAEAAAGVKDDAQSTIRRT
jgi:hypothetical protein